MISALRDVRRSLALAAVSAALFAGCANPLVANVQPTPTPFPTPAPPQKPTFKVTRGSIIDIVQAVGRVVAVQQQDLYFRVPGHLSMISVNVQDHVKKGQVLAALDTQDLQKQIQVQQEAIAVAELKIQQAKQDATSANAGKTGDVNIAAAGVQQAKSNVDIQTAKLSAMLRGPDPNAVAKAQADVQKAETDVQKAQAVQIGDQTAVQAAQSAVQAAQAGINAAQASSQNSPANLQSALAVEAAAKAKLDALKAGPLPGQVAVLRGNVAQAQNALNAAQVSRDGLCNGNAHPAYECQAAQVKVNQAQVALDTANQQLALNLAPPTASDLTAAQSVYDQAKAAYDAAVSSAQSATGVTSAQAAYDKAKTAYEQAVSQKQQDAASVAGAQATLAQSVALLHIAQTGATPQDIHAQRASVASAQAGVAAAIAGLGKAQDVAGATVSSDTTVAILVKEADQARIQLAALNQTLANNTIVAPFDGIVISAQGQPGDNVLAYTPVITVANPTTLQIAADVPSDQVAKIAVGQKATVVMDAFPSTTLKATVVQLPTVVLASTTTDVNAPGGASASTSSSGSSTGTVVDQSPKLKVNWPGPGAELGQLARVTITVQKKNNALIIPTQALNRITNRTFVMLLDKNGRQHPQDVTVGISTPDQTEILTGLKAGQTVVSR